MHGNIKPICKLKLQLSVNNRALVASFPNPPKACVEEEKRAWYQPWTHAQVLGKPYSVHASSIFFNVFTRDVIINNCAKSAVESTQCSSEQ